MMNQPRAGTGASFGRVHQMLKETALAKVATQQFWQEQLLITEFKCDILHEARAANGDYQMFLLKNEIAQSLHALILQLNQAIRFELILTIEEQVMHHNSKVFRIPAQTKVNFADIAFQSSSFRGERNLKQLDYHIEQFDSVGVYCYERLPWYNIDKNAESFDTDMKIMNNLNLDQIIKTEEEEKKEDHEQQDGELI